MSVLRRSNQCALRKQTSLHMERGMEGMYINRDCFKGQKIAVLTSGGDSQGMNSAVRAVVRMGLYCGSEMYTVREGYQGLVDGGTYIRKTQWNDVSGIMNIGGTVIGSARCKAFLTLEGRQSAALNLIKNGIKNLIVIGGDGSLTGANTFKEEWSDMLSSLCSAGKITEEESKRCNRLNVVGLVGSIDNDFCGTDMTIGTDTALHRIIEACDAISSTASSHKRCFVLEVMGRRCGYLALVASLACEAEWVFIPEMPPENDWQERLCKRLKQNKELKQRLNIVIIAEGARDRQGQQITAEQVKQLITERVKLDTRVTVLGHVQRGGSPSAFDRILGIRMGAEAVLTLIDAENDESIGASVVTLYGNETVRGDLVKCVTKTRAITKAMEEKDFEEAVKNRGKSFMKNLETYKILSKTIAPKHEEKFKYIGVINVGSPACGMNAVMRTFTRLMINKGYRIIGINEGFKGLINDRFEDLTWEKVRGWVSMGGSKLGIRRVSMSDVGIDIVSQKLAQLNLSGLLIIGGFEAFVSALKMAKMRQEYPIFQMPILCVPATISNNVPGSEFSLGTDSSLNEITQIIEKIKQSATGTKRRVFIVETQGGNCGYLASMSGLAGGADAALIFEEEFNLSHLSDIVKRMHEKFENGVKRGLIVMNENADDCYSTDFMVRLFQKEGAPVFDSKSNVPGHVQQGGAPSPFDRNLGIKFGLKAGEWFHKMLENDDYKHSSESASLVGLKMFEMTFTPLIQLEESVDFCHKLPKYQWWMRLRHLLKIMAGDFSQ